MKGLLRLEELGMLLASLLFTYLLPVHWPWYFYLLIFFSPDLGMLGYAAGPKAGAWLYNLLHHKGLALLLTLLAWYLGDSALQAIGALFFAHASFDRILGYGLKHSDHFQHTHLGVIGKQAL